MAKTLPTTFDPVSPQTLGASGPITADAETALVENVHHLWGYVAPTVILTVYTEPGQPYVAGSAGGVIASVWPFEVNVNPWTHYRITVHYENTGPTTPGDDGTVRFDWSSDPYSGGTGTYVDLAARGGTSAWGVVSGSIAVPSAASLDILRMTIINGASGQVRVHSVDVRPYRLASLASWAAGDTFVPFDTAELDQDSPLTVAHRRALAANLEAIRTERFGSVVGWSDELPVRSSYEAFATTSTTDVEMVRIAFYAPLGATRLRWALMGYDATGGTVTLTTDSDDLGGETPVSVTLATSASSPYTAAVKWWGSGGDASLGVTPDAWQEVTVAMRTTSGTARLLALCMWLA